MRLNPPSLLIFLIAAILAVLALITHLNYIAIPRYIPNQSYWLAITAYVTLMVGTLVRGL